MIVNKYAPSVFSRTVWFLLAVNSFAAVIVSNSADASITLALSLLIGNAAMCLVSFWKGTKLFGWLEIVCLMLLLLSGIFWITIDAPIINLLIGLSAHFIGAVPTYKQVWQMPKGESKMFWGLFFLASVLSLVVSLDQSLTKVILPFYFILFDGSILLLCFRKTN